MSCWFTKIGYSINWCGMYEKKFVIVTFQSGVPTFGYALSSR